MNYSLRHSRILRLLAERGTISVTELARCLEVSAETIRRDVKLLARSGDIVRMRGAIGLPSVLGEPPFKRRMRENKAAKEAVAQYTASTIQDGESIMFDTGTTTSYLARALLNHRRLTVVTNSSDIARTLATVNGNKVYMAGGELRSDSGAALGLSAIEFVNRFSVDHAIISAGAVNAVTGIVDYDLAEAQFGQAVLTRGQRRIVVADASKFGQKGLVQVCPLDQIHALVVDQNPPPELAQALQLADVTIEVCGP